MTGELSYEFDSRNPLGFSDAFFQSSKLELTDQLIQVKSDPSSTTRENVLTIRGHANDACRAILDNARPFFDFQVDTAEHGDLDPILVVALEKATRCQNVV